MMLPACVQFSLLNLIGSLAVAAVDYSKEDRRVIDQTPMTIRVITGQTASLPCTVDPRYTEQHADQYKVIWVNPVETAISIQDRRILNDDRMSVERPFLRDWNLHIRNVSLTDKGVYKCQINTRPVGTKRVELIVHEPPSITDHTKPSDIERPEKDTIELFCNATGTPPPEITWYRLNRRTNGVREIPKYSLVEGDPIRHRQSKYSCSMLLQTQPYSSPLYIFPHGTDAPEIHLPNSRLGQYLGKDTILECEVNAFPLGTVLWRHRNRPMSNTLTSEVNLYNKLDDSVILSLRLQQISKEDLGTYECYADNSLGVTTKSMTLYEIPPRRSSSTTTTTQVVNVWGKNHQGNGDRSGANSMYHRHRDGNESGGNGKGKNSGLVRDHQQANLYGAQVDSNDGALGQNGGRNYAPSEGGSKYTGVIDNDNNPQNASPTTKCVVLVYTVATFSLLAITSAF
ncbi:hypothetical protein EGW08_005476 [Elysia chlorotica]|uniref:Ig-like domain-containing protein n=1 Tax=Elysia chlorotica TaxID=188477 RepID=A0A3S1BEZ8_ELYCH|nr:hypothetical protein EGW08_005476 [Elysia chlorotica]